MGDLSLAAVLPQIFTGLVLGIKGRAGALSGLAIAGIVLSSIGLAGTVVRMSRRLGASRAA